MKHVVREMAGMEAASAAIGTVPLTFEQVTESIHALDNRAAAMYEAAIVEGKLKPKKRG